MFLSNYYKWKKAINDLVITQVDWRTDLGITTDIKSTSNTNAKIFKSFATYDSTGNIMNTVLQRIITGINNNSHLLWNPSIVFSSDDNEPLGSDYAITNPIGNLTLSNLNFTATPGDNSIKTIITFTVTNANSDSVVLNKFGVTRVLRSSLGAGRVYDNAYEDFTVLIAEGFLNSLITLAPGASESVYIELNEENS